jgi:hypothetical protein
MQLVGDVLVLAEGDRFEGDQEDTEAEVRAEMAEDE